MATLTGCAFESSIIMGSHKRSATFNPTMSIN